MASQALVRSFKPTLSTLPAWRALAGGLVHKRLLTDLRYKGGQAYGDKQYWETPEDLDKIRRRAEIRLRLKQEWQRIRYNPYNRINKIQYEDAAMSRFTAVRAYEDYFKWHWPFFWYYFATNWLPFIIVYAIFQEHHWTKESAIRAGLIPYGDRLYKMI